VAREPARHGRGGSVQRFGEGLLLRHDLPRRSAGVERRRVEIGAGRGDGAVEVGRGGYIVAQETVLTAPIPVMALEEEHDATIFAHIQVELVARVP